MDTKFSKLPENKFPDKWSQYFNAGDAWLSSLEVLENNKNEISWGIFYVTPFMISFCIELYVKALVSHHTKNVFNWAEFHHKTTEIIEIYNDKIQFFNKINSNKKLMKLINEFENTKHTKFGGTYVSIDGDDQRMMMNTIYEFRSEMCRITGLR